MPAGFKETPFFGAIERRAILRLLCAFNDETFALANFFGRKLAFSFLTLFFKFACNVN